MNIWLESTAYGVLTYRVEGPASELPAVTGRDILAAWELARDAAKALRQGGARVFCFQCIGDRWAILALEDADARCWASAVDGVFGLQTSRGLSICLRLLGLVELLAQTPWTAGLVTLQADEARLHPALLRLAAETQLTDDARFDPAPFRKFRRDLSVSDPECY